ncbi:winged helix-turn-helix domain-containing protein [Tahibacter sp. UC22_41]|uniref:winged helix-turn-helix domain-containing protein n=1 Tax=Tahibacter sp. UC22_41 TaxID=3350178 RepID=UPI0036DE60E5
MPARIFDCVLYLIEHRARAVGRDELIAAVWNQPEVGDNVLAQLLARTRKLLNDDGGEQRVIRTVPGFGYHWVATTQVNEAAAPTPQPAATIPQPPSTEPQPPSTETPSLSAAPAPPSLAPEPTPPSRSHRRRRLVGAALVAVLVLFSGVVLRNRLGRDSPDAIGDAVAPTAATSMSDSDPPPLPLPQRPALVLPAIVDPTEGQGWLRLGIMAIVAERLDGAGRSTVPSDNSVALMKGRDPASLNAAALTDLAASAGANWIVQPRVEPLGQRWRVSLEIVHGQAPIRLSVSAESDEVLAAARDAADRLLAGVGGAAAPVTGVDAGLVVVLKKAQAANLDGKPEAARLILDAAQEQYRDSTDLAYELGRMEYRTGRFDAAQRRFEALAAAATKPEQAVLRARALNALAQICYQRRDFACVDGHSRAVIDLLQNRSDGMNELGRAWSELSNLASSTQRYDESMREGARARVLLAASGDWLGVTRSDALSGVMLRRAGRLSDSLALLSRAAERLQAFHEESHEGVVRTHMVIAWTQLGEPQTALTQEPRLRELIARIDYPALREAMQLILADLLLENGRTADAKVLVERAYPLIIDSNDRINQYFAHALAARLALALSEPARAEEEAAQAVETLFDPDEDPRHVAHTYLILLRLQAAHDVPAAQRTAGALRTYIEAAPAKPVNAYAHLAEAVLAVARADAAAARTAFEHAQAAPELVPQDRLRVAGAYVPWLIAQGDLDRAAEIVGALGDAPYRNFDAAVLEVRLYLATRQRAAWQSALDRADALANERRVDPALRVWPAAR